MKIRIKGNSIRLRLTRSEVEAVATKGYISEQTSFGSGVFRYSLKAVEGIDQLNADFKEGMITLYLPKSSAALWYNTEQVGFEHQLTFKTGQMLYLLVEKDFVCMDKTTEDQSDNYPNPLASK